MATTRSKKTAIELGDSGTTIFNGIIVGDEYRIELRGRGGLKIYDEMRRGDATVHAGLMAVKYPIISVPWSAESGGEEDVDQQAKELVDYNFTEVLNWRETLTDILTMLDFGFFVAELVFDWRTVDGFDRIVLVKVASAGRPVSRSGPRKTERRASRSVRGTASQSLSLPTSC